MKDDTIYIYERAHRETASLHTVRKEHEQENKGIKRLAQSSRHLSQHRTRRLLSLSLSLSHSLSPSLRVLCDVFPPYPFVSLSLSFFRRSFCLASAHFQKVTNLSRFFATTDDEQLSRIAVFFFGLSEYVRRLSREYSALFARYLEMRALARLSLNARFVFCHFLSCV